MNVEQRYVPSEVTAREKLALYYYDGCPYCSVVNTFIDSIGVDVEFRNILEVPRHRADLVQERGRATVPVLRIVSPDGEEQWMPESRDIADYLKATYG
jgi:glutathione S-transferase